MVADERGQLRLDDLIDDEDDVAIAAVTVVELLVGVELASPAHRPRRLALVESIIATIPIEDYDLDVTADRSGFTDLPGSPSGPWRAQRPSGERGRSGATTTMVPFMPAAQWPRTWQP